MSTTKPPTGEDDFYLTEEKLDVVRKCIEYAKEYFQEPESERYGEVTWWDDGDFRIQIRHGFGELPAPSVHHHEDIRYKASTGQIIYLEGHQNMVDRTIDVLKHEIIEEVEIEGDYE